MTTPRFLIPVLLGSALAAQTTTVFPDEYAGVAEGPTSSNNLPFSRGSSRVQCLYDGIDLAIPSGQQITQIGYRQDGPGSTIYQGRNLQLEVRMGYSNEDHATMGTDFANNYNAPPTTVFGPAIFSLPNLKDPAAPLPNGQFFITLTTPFTYNSSLGNLVVEYLIYGNSGGSTSWTYRLDRSDYLSTVAYGPAGCPHSGSSIPNMTLQPARPGLSFSASVTGAPGTSFGILAVAVGQTMVAPFGLQSIVGGISPACTGQIQLNGALTMTGFTSGSGAKNWSFQIPNSPAFADYYFSSQAVFFDFFAPGGAVVSNGGEMMTGVRPRTSILSATGPPVAITTGSVSRWYNPIPFFVHQ